MVLNMHYETTLRELILVAPLRRDISNKGEDFSNTESYTCNFN